VLNAALYFSFIFTCLSGGYDGQNNLTCVEMYDPALDEWVLAPPMVAHEGGVGVASLRTKAKYS